MNQNHRTTPVNTALTYTFSAANRPPVSATVIVSGVATKGDVTAILASLDAGEFFIPHQVGLTDLRFESAGPDVVWHSLTRDGIVLTAESPTIPVSIEDLARRFQGTKWDEIEAKERVRQG